MVGLLGFVSSVGVNISGFALPALFLFVFLVSCVGSGSSFIGVVLFFWGGWDISVGCAVLVCHAFSFSLAAVWHWSPFRALSHVFYILFTLYR